jgi:hypothetical protein
MKIRTSPNQDFADLLEKLAEFDGNQLEFNQNQDLAESAEFDHNSANLVTLVSILIDIH